MKTSRQIPLEFLSLHAVRFQLKLFAQLIVDTVSHKQRANLYLKFATGKRRSDSLNDLKNKKKEKTRRNELELYNSLQKLEKS